ncbi:alpha/beta hydrolase [Alphaproteobacteria bacterium]|nr:alpha/beta hydrolase [Alphaproteobacteria bacterium]
MENEHLEASVVGKEHWTKKGDIDLFLWNKYLDQPGEKKGTILFVHGSSMASQPTFDLHVEGRPFSSAMNYFAVLGYDTWCVDMEGYGRSSKHRDITCDIANGADDLTAATAYIQEYSGAGSMHMYGISSGALRAAAFTERHPERIARLALDAFVWTGEGSPTLADRSKKLPEFRASTRRPIDYAFVQSIFNRDHPDCVEPKVVDAFAKAICALDDSMPNGTYIDMCSRLPLVDPEKITVPTIILRGQYDGIASVTDLLKFFEKLPHNDKQFTVMEGISHASFQQKNYAMVYDILAAFLDRTPPVYK